MRRSGGELFDADYASMVPFVIREALKNLAAAMAPSTVMTVSVPGNFCHGSGEINQRGLAELYATIAWLAPAEKRSHP